MFSVRRYPFLRIPSVRTEVHSFRDHRYAHSEMYHYPEWSVVAVEFSDYLVCALGEKTMDMFIFFDILSQVYVASCEKFLSALYTSRFLKACSL